MVRLQDYEPFAWQLESVDLDFRIFDEKAVVHSTLSFQSRSDGGALVLYGEDLALQHISCNGVQLRDTDYSVQGGALTIHHAPSVCVVDTIVHLDPDSNTRLDGLYRSHGLYCTQCEAQGFRRITFFPDRPDVSSVYTVRIEADKIKNPLLLSNGNCIEQGDLEGNRHYAVFHDPHRKPSYLFALVAGDLASRERTFTTTDGRSVSLKIHAEVQHIEKCHFALDALIASMRWDERRFDLQYDLDVFHIVAVDYFNSGAMENKGLNIFNTKLVYADPEIATDADYERVEAVVAHEYFHNWTGNRVTCRDWLQLTLKEGLTVFRDQEFTADERDAGIKRVEDAKLLFEHQFLEDAGALAHPIRPRSYESVNNLYTVTVYEKGGEVVRLYQTLLGKKGFAKGLQHYLKKHDGTGATVEDFCQSMGEANGQDLSALLRWYDQVGTPQLTLTTEHKGGSLHIQLSQDQQPPVPIPFVYGVLNADGTPAGVEAMEVLEEHAMQWCIKDVTADAVLSPLRGLSAPVKLKWDARLDEWLHLLRYDSDDYNRWAAAQQAYHAILVREEGEALIVSALQHILQDDSIRPRLRSLLLTLPSIRSLLCSAPVDRLCERTIQWKTQLSQALLPDWQNQYDRACAALPDIYTPDKESVGWRSLKNTALHYWALSDVQCASEQYDNARNMTDRMGAMQAILARPKQHCARREQILQDFYDRYQHEPLMVDRWFNLSVSMPHSVALEYFKVLLNHVDYDCKLPNRVRALIGGLMANPYAFHEASGSAYALVADTLLQVDVSNPQTAARLFTQFDGIQHLDAARQSKVQSALQSVLPQLSPNSGDHVRKVLKSIE